MPAGTSTAFEIHPVTPDRWPDLEALFGPQGAYGGCWCMWFRLTREQFRRDHGAANRQAMRRIVEAGEVPGLLAYADGRPAGWVSVAPRPVFGSIERSRVLKRIDDEPVWSIVCFYIDKGFRRQGLMAGLLRAAVEHARGRGARIVEGYPVEPQGGRLPEAWAAYRGLVTAFRGAGFVEVARRSPDQPIMRYYADGP